MIRQNQKAFNIYFPEDVLKQMQDKADELGMSTSGLIRTICTEYVTGKQIIHREQQPQPDWTPAKWNATSESQP